MIELNAASSCNDDDAMLEASAGPPSFCGTIVLPRTDPFFLMMWMKSAVPAHKSTEHNRLLAFCLARLLVSGTRSTRSSLAPPPRTAHREAAAGEQRHGRQGNRHGKGGGMVQQP